MNTTAVTGKIIFYYKHDDLFEDVQHQSAFMCKNIVSKEGEDLMERYAITDDEKPMLQLCLRETMPDVYDIMKPIMYGIDPAYYESITGTQLKGLDSALANLDVEASADYTVVIVQNNGAYNPNTVRVVDSALCSTLEQGILASFYERVTHPDLTGLSMQMFTAQSGSLNQRIIPLRKKTVL